MNIMMKRFGMLLVVAGIILPVSGQSFVKNQEGKTYLVDRWGERWDVTQAASLGFKPEGFQFGIGRNAFTPLDDSGMDSNPKKVPDTLRIIGIADEDRAQAYSVPTLGRHEIANSHFGAEAIAVGYWPLVNLTAVYSRQIDGRTLTLAPSGWTYRNTFVLYDKETGSLWYPFQKGLMSIQGVYFKRRLNILPSQDVIWEQWHGRYPHTILLK